MLDTVKNELASNRLSVRIITAYVIFLVVFFGVMILSYYLLPDGLLKNKHPLHNWDTSPLIWVSTLQIFGFNLFSVLIMQIGNLFATRINQSEKFLPYGYYGLFTQITFNALVLGTWSFSVEHESLALLGRIFRTFDIFNRAGLWEMTGQLLTVCATAKAAIVVIDGKSTFSKKLRDIRLKKEEIFTFILGIAFLLIGALVESCAIIEDY